MSTFVLIHGAWHGAWCWYKVVPALERAGHMVLAPDLSGLGRDQTPLGSLSLEQWVREVCSLIDAAADPVILVGHSRGGVVIGEVAERQPDRVACLVYVTAFLLRDGETLLQVAATAADSSKVVPNLVVADDELSMTIRDEHVVSAFYGQCAPEDVTLARMLLRPEPTAPNATPVRLTDARFGRVPKFYIECLRDAALPIALQRSMAQAGGCRIVASLDTDHSPFFSMTGPLVDALCAIGQGAAP